MLCMWHVGMYDDIVYACMLVHMLCQHEGILSMYVSVVCSMRDVRNVVHVKFDTDHPPTLNVVSY